jgi:Ni/Co efflux regulator RcnB
MNRVNPWALSLIVSAAALAAACAPAAMAADAAQPAAAHAHDDAHPAKLRLDHGRKWKTDAPLREGMTRIRSLVAAKLPSAHAGTMGAAEYAALAAQVEVEVGNIVAKCKLAPEADAVLHVVVADLMGGTAAMAGRTPGVTAEKGLVQAVAAVNGYGRYFEHPGWKPIHTAH